MDRFRQWGNLTNETGISGKTNAEGLNCAANTYNQLTTCPFVYDPAGNMTSNGGTTYVYDAENRLVWTTGGYRYIYDGDGNRVEKCVAGSATTPCPTSGTNGTLYWMGDGSAALDESDLSGNMLEQYVFFGSARVARRDVSPSAVHYYFSDHLGSHSVVENATGTACEQDIDYYPYGGQENDYCPNVAQHYKFTGKERDTESGLDDFGARHYSGGLGRFMQTDPIWVKADRMLDPQRLNLYAYGRNNPLKFADPTGMDLKMGGCPSDMTTSMCEAAVTNGLQKDDRSHVHFVEGDGKNGLKKGETQIQVDKDYKSNSGNFTRLQSLANDHSGTGVLNIVGPTQAFPHMDATGWSSKSGTTFGKGETTLGHLSDPDAFHGQTLFPWGSSPHVALGEYTPLPWTEVYANSEDSAVELAVDFAHELVHVRLGDFGKKPKASFHQNPVVEKQIKEAEDEARTNAQH